MNWAPPSLQEGRRSGWPMSRSQKQPAVQSNNQKRRKKEVEATREVVAVCKKQKNKRWHHQTVIKSSHRDRWNIQRIWWWRECVPLCYVSSPWMDTSGCRVLKACHYLLIERRKEKRPHHFQFENRTPTESRTLLSVGHLRPCADDTTSSFKISFYFHHCRRVELNKQRK